MAPAQQHEEGLRGAFSFGYKGIKKAVTALHEGGEINPGAVSGLLYRYWKPQGHLICDDAEKAGFKGAAGYPVRRIENDALPADRFRVPVGKPLSSLLQCGGGLVDQRCDFWQGARR